MRYKIGWKRNGKWHYVTVNSKADMLGEVADKTSLSDKVSVTVISDHNSYEGGKK